MFYLKYETNMLTDIYVVRATKEKLKEANGNLREIKDPGYLTVFNTELGVRNVKEIDRAFSVLNNYVQWRGDEYIEKLYREYETISNLANDYTIASDVESDAIKAKFTIELTKIIDMLDSNSIYDFISVVQPLEIPAVIKSEFDTTMVTDGVGSRDQTYIEEDYKQLMVLIVIFKAITGPLAQMIFSTDDGSKKMPDLQMLDMIRQQPIAQGAGFKKLAAYVRSTVEKVFDKEKTGESKVLSFQLPREEIPMYYLAKIIFNKILLMDQADSTNKDIVRQIYGTISSGIKSIGNSNDTIRNKNKPSESETETEDKESVIESYRLATDVTPGIAEELNWATETVDKILKQLPPKVRELCTDDNIKLGMSLAATFTPDKITNTHINILGPIFKNIIDPRGLLYLKANSIFNLIAVGYAILIGMKAFPLAYALVSKRISGMEADSVHYIATNINSTKAKGYREEELEKYYPSRKVVVGKRSEDDSKSDKSDQQEYPGDLVILDWVSSMGLEINKYNWLVPSILNVGVKDIIVSTISNVLIDFLIENEQRNEK